MGLEERMNEYTIAYIKETAPKFPNLYLEKRRFMHYSVNAIQKHSKALATWAGRFAKKNYA